MPALHIRDMSDSLYRKLKSDAALRGMTLREYVLLKLGEETRVEASRIPDVLPKPAIRADVGRESVPAKLAAAIPGVTTAAKLANRCVCGETRDLHLRGTGRCQSKNCECLQYRAESIA